MEETFEMIYCIFGRRTIQNEYSYYFDGNGKKKLPIEVIMKQMNETLWLSGNNNMITVWNEMIELTPYNYTNYNGINCASRIFDSYVKQIYLNGERKFQVATNIRYNNITRNALMILTICTSSFTYNGQLNIDGSDIVMKSEILKQLIRQAHHSNRFPKCKLNGTQDMVYNYQDYEDPKYKQAIVFD